MVHSFTDLIQGYLEWLSVLHTVVCRISVPLKTIIAQYEITVICIQLSNCDLNVRPDSNVHAYKTRIGNKTSFSYTACRHLIFIVISHFWCNLDQQAEHLN